MCLYYTGAAAISVDNLGRDSVWASAGVDNIMDEEKGRINSRAPMLFPHKDVGHVTERRRELSSSPPLQARGRRKLSVDDNKTFYFSLMCLNILHILACLALLIDFIVFFFFWLPGSTVLSAYNFVTLRLASMWLGITWSLGFTATWKLYVYYDNDPKNQFTEKPVLGEWIRNTTVLNVALGTSVCSSIGGITYWLHDSYPDDVSFRFLVPIISIVNLVHFFSFSVYTYTFLRYSIWTMPKYWNSASTKTTTIEAKATEETATEATTTETTTTDETATETTITEETAAETKTTEETAANVTGSITTEEKPSNQASDGGGDGQGADAITQPDGEQTTSLLDEETVDEQGQQEVGENGTNGESKPNVEDETTVQT